MIEKNKKNKEEKEYRHPWAYSKDFMIDFNNPSIYALRQIKDGKLLSIGNIYSFKELAEKIIENFPLDIFSFHMEVGFFESDSYLWELAESLAVPGDWEEDVDGYHIQIESKNLHQWLEAMAMAKLREVD